LAKIQQSNGQQPSTRGIRDAQGNRRRVSRGRAGGNKARQLEIMIEMYGIRDDLAERVLAGEMNLLTARSLQRRRRGARRKPAGRLKTLLARFTGMLVV
jgi:hypothetical protein